MNSHHSLGVAQIVLFLPALLAALSRSLRHDRPHFPWLYLILSALGEIGTLELSLSPRADITTPVHVASGTICIRVGRRPHDVGLLVAYEVLLNLSIFPLLLATVRLLRIM